MRRLVLALVLVCVVVPAFCCTAEGAQKPSRIKALLITGADVGVHPNVVISLAHYGWCGCNTHALADARCSLNPKFVKTHSHRYTPSRATVWPAHSRAP